MSEEEGEKHGTVFWILITVLLIVAVVIGSYVQWNFRTGQQERNSGTLQQNSSNIVDEHYLQEKEISLII